MALFDLELRPEKHQLRSFGLFWLPGFCLLVALFAWLQYDQDRLALVLATVSLVSILVSLIQPRILQPLFVVLMGSLFLSGLLSAIY